MSQFAHKISKIFQNDTLDNRCGRGRPLAHILSAVRGGASAPICYHPQSDPHYF